MKNNLSKKVTLDAIEKKLYFERLNHWSYFSTLHWVFIRVKARSQVQCFLTFMLFFISDDFVDFSSPPASFRWLWFDIGILLSFFTSPLHEVNIEVGEVMCAFRLACVLVDNILTVENSKLDSLFLLLTVFVYHSWQNYQRQTYQGNDGVTEWGLVRILGQKSSLGQGN